LFFTLFTDHVTWQNAAWLLTHRGAVWRNFTIPYSKKACRE